jgi:hypothetical protein
MKPKAAEHATAHPSTHRTSDSVGSHSSFEEGIMMRTREEKGKSKEIEHQGLGSSTTSLQASVQYSPSDADFSLDGSAVWVENHPDQMPHLPSSIGSTHTATSSRSTSSSVRGRKSTDASSTSSAHPKESRTATPAPNATPPVLKDTHYFPATIDYNDHQLPIRLPMYTFPEEVGDVRLYNQQLRLLTNLLYLVFTHPARADVLKSFCLHIWSPTSSLTYEWKSNPSYHSAYKRARH